MAAATTTDNLGPLRTLEGHTSIVLCCAFSSDGSLLATTSWNRTAKLWKIPQKTL